ncbi:MAG TPA: DUF1634 domain-containing protein [Thermoplasmata archaeon]|nr:DUF1634 domain-containing protein [Thermoplasmata archaeon]
MNAAASPEVLPIPPPRLPEHARERMAIVLRSGLGVAVAILLAALIAYLLQNPGASAGSVVGANPIVPYLTGSGFASGLARGAPSAYLTLGTYVLIATPVVRVLTGVYYFRRDGERTMMWVTLTVLGLLLLGLFVFGPLIR